MQKLMVIVVLGVVLSAWAIGCSGRPSLIGNADPALRKSSAQFAADAATRFPYPADAPKGGEAVARAQVGYTLNVIEIINLSDEEWRDVEVRVNGTHVVFVPVMQPKKLKQLPFQMIFDHKGNYFPLSNKKVLVDKVEILRDGKLYTVTTKQAD
jgi:hypothetical protein